MAIHTEIYTETYTETHTERQWDKHRYAHTWQRASKPICIYKLNYSEGGSVTFILVLQNKLYLYVWNDFSFSSKTRKSLIKIHYHIFL